MPTDDFRVIRAPDQMSNAVPIPQNEVSGTYIYSSKATGALDSNDVAILINELEFDVDALSTVAITVSFTADAEFWDNDVNFNWSIDGYTVLSPKPMRASSVTTAATTMDEGTHVIIADITGASDMNTVYAECTITVIVGAHTGSNTIDYVTP